MKSGLYILQAVLAQIDLRLKAVLLPQWWDYRRELHVQLVLPFKRYLYAMWKMDFLQE